MSHIVSIATKVRDPVAATAACKRLSLAEPIQGKAELFSGPVEGLIVRLPNWRYPAVIDTETGTVKYDNFGGAWGDQAELHRFLQAYAVEKARIEARKKGHSVTEQSLDDGSILLRIAEGT